MRQLPGYKAHWINQDGNAIVSKGSIVYRYDYKNDSLDKIVELQYNNKFFGIVNRGILEKLFRGGIHHILNIYNTYVIFFDRKIITLSDSEIQSIYNIQTCKRPLNVCINPVNKHIYWGDYIAGKERLPINIYRSKNKGKDWEIVYTFQSGVIRHIHNIIYDIHQNHYWILTGDTDHESGIWMTKDFKKMAPIFYGSQKYRATALIPLNDGLVIPTDTELEENHIQYYSYSENTLHSILEIPSSSIDAKQINGISFISTMVEPSLINKSKNVRLYASLNNKNWTELLSIKKGFLSGKYFQYSLINFPYYDNNYLNNNYYFNIRNTVGDNGIVIYLKNELLDLMDSAR